MDERHTEPRDETPIAGAVTPHGAIETTAEFGLPGTDPSLGAPPGYELLGVLGRGGMGVVYRARQVSLNRQVALKTIAIGTAASSSAQARFEQEAQTAARLQHPHIVSVYDFGRHAGRLFLAMELVEGQDLEDFIHHRGQLDEATAWGLVRQAASGLAHAAAAGIVHRDIKPANLLLVTPPAGFPLPPGMPLVKVADFGLALLADSSRDARLTTEGATVGSPHYMAPEQVLGAPVDHRADIYGLGATAYHMLTGQPPFPGETVGQIIAHKVRGETPPLETSATVSKATRDLVLRMMHAAPGSRPASYDELLRLIDALDHSASGHRTEPKTVPAPRLVRRLRPRDFVIASAVAVIILAALVWRFWPSNSVVSVPTYVPAGWAAPLFDGQTLKGFMPRQGTWSPTIDVEGGRVLEGAGVIVRPLPQPDKPERHALTTYRITMGCNLGEATAAELQFGISAAPPHARFVLRLEPTAMTLGRRDGDTGPLSHTKVVNLPATPADPSAPVYREMRVERHADHWVAYANGVVFAVVKPVGGEDLAEIRLATVAGPAQFDSPQVTELKLSQP